MTSSGDVPPPPPSAEAGEEFEGMAVVDFDMLCATVAMQTKGVILSEKRRGDEEEMKGEEDFGGVGGVERMWEGDIVMDCFDDRRIAIESACCPCYRFGKNMRRANLGSCFLQGTAYLLFVIAILFNLFGFIITKRHSFLFIGVSLSLLAGAYLGFFRTRIRKQFNIRGSDSSLDDCANHLICPCCTLSQESRTLEMNNVHDGIWHGRTDTICLGSYGEGSKAFSTLNKPSLMPIRSPDICSMGRGSDSSEHSWIADISQSQPLVPST